MSRNVATLRSKATRLTLALATLVLLLCLTPLRAFAWQARTLAPEAGNTWYYSDTNPYYRHRYADGGLAPCGEQVDGRYVIGNCTWYAWGRAAEVSGSALKLSASDPIGLWDEARSTGAYETGTTPRAGAIAVGYGAYNAHVAFVEAVVGDQVIVSESAYTTSSSWPGYENVVHHYGDHVTYRMEGGVVGYIYIVDTPDTDPLDTSSRWDRLWGQTAYDTMQAIVQTGGVFTDATCDTVIVATGDGYWDALAASGLAGLYDAPVLITPKSRLADQTASELLRLKPSRVLIMGGPAAITEGVKEAIAGLSSTWSVERVYGANAADTAVEIYQRGLEGKGWSRTAIIATSGGYWDALSIAPYAYASGSPIFLTTKRAEYGHVLHDGALTAIDAGNFDRVIIVGGPAAISTQVEAQLAQAGLAESQILRLYGETAIETSAAIALWEINSGGMSATHLAIATSNGYWDALTGAALAGQQNSVLVLVDKGGQRTAAFDEVYGNYGSQLKHGYVLGGPAALSYAVSEHLVGA